MFFFVWFLVPETKGLSLEAMDELFGVTEAHKAPSLDGAGSSRADEKPHAVAEQSEIQK